MSDLLSAVVLEHGYQALQRQSFTTTPSEKFRFGV